MITMAPLPNLAKPVNARYATCAKDMNRQKLQRVAFLHKLTSALKPKQFFGIEFSFDFQWIEMKSNFV